MLWLLDLGSVVITGVAASRSCNWECYVARQLVRASVRLRAQASSL